MHVIDQSVIVPLTFICELTWYGICWSVPVHCLDSITRVLYLLSPVREPLNGMNHFYHYPRIVWKEKCLRLEEWQIDTDELTLAQEYIDLSNSVHRLGLLFLAVHYVLLHAIVVFFTSINTTDLLTWYLVISAAIYLLSIVTQK